MKHVRKFFLSIVVILSMSASGEAGFPIRIGGANTDYGKAVAVDSAGYIYAAGYFQGTVNFGGIEKTAYGSADSAAEVDVFLAKYSPMGDVRWVRTISGAGSQMPHSLVISGKNIYMIGYISGTATFEGSGNPALDAGAGRNAFVCKYDTDGNFVWAFDLGDEESGELSADDTRFEDGFDLTTDSAGNIYITGTFNGTIDLDPSDGNDSSDTFTSNSGSRDIFAASYTPDGKYRGGFVIGGSGQDHGHAIRVSEDGSIFLGGFFSGTADFEPGRNVNLLGSSGGWDAFFAKYDANGKNLLAKKFGGEGNDQVRPGGMEIRKIDGAERVCMGGDFTGGTDFNFGSGVIGIQSSGANDLFVSCYDTSGNALWAKSASGPETASEFVHRLSIDSLGNVYAAGQVAGQMTFSTGEDYFFLKNIGKSDAFVLKYDKDGNFVWGKTIGGYDAEDEPDDVGTGLAIDIWDNVYVTGKFFGAAGSDLQSAGNTDAFVMRYSSENTCLNVGSDLDIRIPCAQYQGKYYQFAMTFYPAPDALIWKLDPNSFSEIPSPASSYMSVEDSLVFNIGCAAYLGTTYQFMMNYEINPDDPAALLWKMDISTFKSKSG